MYGSVKSMMFVSTVYMHKFLVFPAGLLTVDTQHRLTLRDLSCHPWLKPQSAPSTPLHITPLHKGTASALKHTFHAFYQATKAGFTLGDVSRARLAKRRKDKRGTISRLEQVVPSQSTADGSVVRPSQLGLNALRT